MLKYSLQLVKASIYHIADQVIPEFISELFINDFSFRFEALQWLCCRYKSTRLGFLSAQKPRREGNLVINCSCLIQLNVYFSPSSSSSSSPSSSSLSLSLSLSLSQSIEMVQLLNVGITRERERERRRENVVLVRLNWLMRWVIPVAADVFRLIRLVICDPGGKASQSLPGEAGREGGRAGE